MCAPTTNLRKFARSSNTPPHRQARPGHYSAPFTLNVYLLLFCPPRPGATKRRRRLLAVTLRILTLELVVMHATELQLGYTLPSCGAHAVRAARQRGGAESHPLQQLAPRMPCHAGALQVPVRLVRGGARVGVRARARARARVGVGVGVGVGVRVRVLGY